MADVATVERTTWTFPSDHLSPSQITEYLSCPLCYKLGRIDRVPRPLAVALPIGGAVHKAVETWRRHWIDFEMDDRDVGDPSGEYTQMAADHFDRALEDADSDIDISAYGSVGEAKDHMVAITRYVLPEIAKLDVARGLVACELDLKDFDNPWPFAMHGRVDALYGPDPDTCNAGADLKTAGKQQTPDFAVALQMAIYRSFVPVTWFVDQAAKTKTPSFATYVLSDDGGDFAYELVMDVADRIARGDFPARPGFRCRYEHGGPSFSVTVAGYNE